MPDIIHAKVDKYCKYKQTKVEVIATIYGHNVLEYVCEDRNICKAYDCNCVSYNLGDGYNYLI